VGRPLPWDAASPPPPPAAGAATTAAAAPDAAPPRARRGSTTAPAHDFEVVVHKNGAAGALGLSCAQVSGQVLLRGFLPVPPQAGGSHGARPGGAAGAAAAMGMGPVQALGSVRVGDEVLAVGDAVVAALAFREVVAAMRAAYFEKGAVRLRMRRGGAPQGGGRRGSSARVTQWAC
jgi:hypothetical protein